MKKLFTLLFMMPLLCISLKAQTNLSFENWSSLGDYDNPDDWQTTNLIVSLVGGDAACSKAGAHWGNHSMRLNSSFISLIGDTIPGFAIQQFASHKRYQSFSFYYQYSSPSSTMASVSVLCFKDSVQGNTPMGEGVFVLTPGASWQFANMDIDWSSVDNPDSIMISIITDVDNLKDTMIIDDIQLSEFTTSLARVSTVAPELFVNSQRQIVLTETGNADPVQLVLSNALGQVVLERKMLPGVVETSSLPAGLYVYRYARDGRVYNGRIVLE